MISAQNISMEFGRVRALDKVSFTLHSGERVGLLGENGAGKTTLMRLITGFLRPARGTLSVAGFDVEIDSQNARRHIGYLPENAPVYPELTVTQYLRYRAKLKDIPAKQLKNEVTRVMDLCQIRQMEKRRSGHLSKGYRQRLGLAEALLGDPDLIILDEPTVGLDPNQVIETRRTIREIAEKKTLLFSSHLLPEVENTCNRVLILDHGRLAADGDMQSLSQELDLASSWTIELLSPDNPESWLQSLPGVTDLICQAANINSATDSAIDPALQNERTGKNQLWQISLHSSSPEARAGLAEAALKKQALIQEMRLKPASLEDLFRRVVPKK